MDDDYVHRSGRIYVEKFMSKPRQDDKNLDELVSSSNSRQDPKTVKLLARDTTVHQNSAFARSAKSNRFEK